MTVALFRMYGVSCDRCAAALGGWPSSKAARAEARRRGWKRIPKSIYSGPRDHCPQCAPPVQTIRPTRGVL